MMPSAVYKYRDCPPWLAEHVPVGDLHSLWVEHSGARDGIPVIALHGGPGVPSEAIDRRLFDPDRFHLIQFDQRGCGRSTPHAEIRENSLWHSVDDIETLRRRAGIERWIVTGHSYGATLALAYAQRHPERCLALVLRGLYLGTAEERDWIVRGWRMMRPDAWMRAIEGFTTEEAEDYYATVALRLDASDHGLRMRTAIAYSRYELECCYANPDPEVIAAQLDPDACYANAVIAAHHAAHDDFLDEGQLLANIERIAAIPAVAIAGLADIVTPPHAAWLLRRHWPSLELCYVGGAGHATTEPGNIRAVTDVMDKFAARFG